MKAAVFHGPNHPLSIEDVEIDKPRERKVLVRTVASGPETARTTSARAPEESSRAGSPRGRARPGRNWCAVVVAQGSLPGARGE